jgi:ATP-binding cassette subfamily B protein
MKDQVNPGRPGRRILRQVLHEQRRGLSFVVFVGCVWNLSKVTIPLFVRTAIDRGIEQDDNGSLLLWSSLIVAAALSAAVFTGLRRYFSVVEGRLAEVVLRGRMFAHLQSMHIAYHDATQTGELMSRANTDLVQIGNLMQLLPMTMASGVLFLVVTILLISISPFLALVALGGLPLVSVVGVVFARRLLPAVMGIQRESAELASVVEESVSGVRVIKGFGAERLQRARLADEAEDLYAESMAATRVRSFYLPAIDVLPNLSLIAVLGFGGHQVLDGDLTLGSFVAFSVYVLMLVMPLRFIGMFIAQAQRAEASAERVHEVLIARPLVIDAPKAIPLPSGRGEVVFENVDFSYTSDDSPPVLHGFNLRLRAGESIAIVGPTGCGKSTVAQLLPRFYDVQAGRILLDGEDIRDIRVRDLRGAVGIVFEDTFLFNDTIAGNIAFGHPDASEASIVRAAQLAGAEEFITDMPNGYGTRIGERGFLLSGGQRQRLAIARAILTDPRILILDDATSSVDPTKEHEIREALREVMAGRTTLVIAHRPATVALADRVLLMNEGRIVADGTHEALMSSNATYREVLAAGVPESRLGKDGQK